MKTKNEKTKEIIIKNARKEFVKRGFSDTSMRNIASDCNLNLSNIYTYFKSKDELYCEILKPTLAAIDNMISNHNSKRNTTKDYFNTEELQHKDLEDMVNLVEKHRLGLSLLFFKSSGSSLENYKDILIEKNYKMGTSYLKIMKEKYPEISIEISPTFLKLMSTMWVNIMLQILSVDISHEETTKFLSNYIQFGTAGWQKLMNIS